jgi:hypothetical protein
MIQLRDQHIIESLTKGVATAGRFDVDFAGMAELYQQISNHYSSIGKSIKFYYVSNAPDFVMKHPHEFMASFNGFPKGEFKLAGLTEKNHKDNVIPVILEQEKPETVIFVGDNGEQDVYVYDGVTKKFNGSNINFTTYIRIAYLIDPKAVKGDKVGKPTQENQIGFASAGEIAVDLFSKGRLEFAAVKKVAETTIDPEYLLIPELGYDKSTNLPYWYDCRSHSIIDLPTEISQDSTLLKHNSQFTDRCKQAPKSKKELGIYELGKLKKKILKPRN